MVKSQLLKTLNKSLIEQTKSLSLIFFQIINLQIVQFHETGDSIFKILTKSKTHLGTRLVWS